MALHAYLFIIEKILLGSFGIQKQRRFRRGELAKLSVILSYYINLPLRIKGGCYRLHRLLCSTNGQENSSVVKRGGESMSWVSWGLNVSVLLVCSVFVYFFRPSFYAKVRRIAIVTMWASYFFLYFIGYWFHAEEFNPAITIRSNGSSISLVGDVIWVGITVLVVVIFSKLRKGD